MTPGSYADYEQAKTVDDEWKAFLESAPANLPHKFSSALFAGRKVGGELQHGIFVPRIDLFCVEDEGSRRFAPVAASFSVPVKQPHWQFLTFQCPDCLIQKKTFALSVWRTETEITVIKLGESPAFGAPISRRVRGLLGGDLDLYAKGLRCEGQGLGIGAAGYFRRIVENRWKGLVKKIRDVEVKLGETALGGYDAALLETRFAAAVDRLKDRLPAKLRLPSGENPLLLLHSALSVGIHELSDAENLEQAEAIRVVLTDLLDKISEALADHAELTESVKRLKQPKARTPPTDTGTPAPGSAEDPS